MVQAFETIEEIREFFKNDGFVSSCLKAHIDSYDFETGEAQVSMDIKENHLNGHGIVMGGVYFTLADFCLAVCANVNQEPSASVSNTINTMKSAKGTRLIAKGAPNRSGHHLGFYTVDVFDDLGTYCARMTATIMRLA